jgi:transcription elongation factor GreA
LVTEQKVLNVKRISAVNNLKTARDMGDLSENAAYRVARSKLSSIDSRLRYLNKVLRDAYILETPSNGIVEVGCFVTVEGMSGKQTFQIVNSHESDISKGKISYYSPVGKALIGRKVKDVVSIKIPKGNLIYKIKQIKIL